MPQFQKPRSREYKKVLNFCICKKNNIYRTSIKAMFSSQEKEYELPLYDSPEEPTTPEKSEYSDNHCYCPGASEFQGPFPPPPSHHRYHNWNFHKRGRKNKSKARKMVAVTSFALVGFSLFTLGRIYEDHTALQNINKVTEEGFRSPHFGAEYGRFPHNMRKEDFIGDLPLGRESHHRKGDEILRENPDEPSGPKHGRPRHGRPRHGNPRHHKPKHHKSKHNETEVDEKFSMEHSDRRFRGKKHHLTDIDSDFSDFSDFSDSSDDDEEHHETKDMKKEKIDNDSEKSQDFKTQDSKTQEFKTQEEPKTPNHHKGKSKGHHKSKPHSEQEKEAISEDCGDKNEGEKLTQNNGEENHKVNGGKGHNVKGPKKANRKDFKEKNNHKKTGQEEPNSQTDILGEMEEIYHNIKESIDNVVNRGIL